jgi:hypothetical protein
MKIWEAIKDNLLYLAAFFGWASMVWAAFDWAAR